MKFAYDADVDALYITVADGNVYQSMAIDENTNVDVSANQGLIGIEVLSLSRYWPLAEIISRWELSTADASMLMGMYPWMYSVSMARAGVVSLG
jgi:uncharacterized protein YuzE